MLISKPKFTTGFTLVELLVTITIFVILTGVVLFSQSKFNSTILLTNLAYDTALTIRQAQTYGINIKEFDVGGTGKFLPYGVHFVKGEKSFILFADINYNENNPNVGGVFAGSDIGTCDKDKGCVNRYSIKRGNYIYDLCINETFCGKTSLDIVFKRPNPDAVIKSNPVDSSISSATIVLKGVDGVSTRKVRVQSNGLIEIINKNEDSK